MVKDGIGHVTQIPLQRDQLEQRVVIKKSFLTHHPFGIHRPAFDKRARLKQMPQLAGIAIGVSKLQEMSRHRLVNRQYIDERVLYSRKCDRVCFSVQSAGMGETA